MTHEIELPWPSSALSPNARVHWRARSVAAKKARNEAFLLAKSVGLVAPQVPPGSRITLELDLFPPDARKRDDDNVISAFKASRDGLAQAMGLDDRLFKTVCTLHHDQPVRGGRVNVRLSAP